MKFFTCGRPKRKDVVAQAAATMLINVRKEIATDLLDEEKGKAYDLDNLLLEEEQQTNKIEMEIEKQGTRVKNEERKIREELASLRKELNIKKLEREALVTQLDALGIQAYTQRKEYQRVETEKMRSVYEELKKFREALEGKIALEVGYHI